MSIKKIVAADSAGNIEYEKQTPKQFARAELADALAVGLGFWQEKNELAFEAMTEREIKLVEEQMNKIADRLFKSLGYDEAWGA